MRRSTSRIGRLPPSVLEAVNEKLAASWEYRRIRVWLFEEVAEEDVPALGLVKGEKFGLVWLRAGKSEGHAWHHCELALGNWFRTHHTRWVRERVLRSEAMRVIKKAKILTQVARGQDSGVGVLTGGNRENRGGCSPASVRGESSGGAESDADLTGGNGGGADEEVSIEGGDILMRSVLIDAISSVEEGGKDRREIAQLANAWARLKQGDVEAEKLRLKSEDALTAGLRAVKAEIMAIPEAMELFRKMVEVVERSKKPVDPLAK